ncbi:MAG: hypothetical protein LBP59_08235 [Planctomycetaceae bacterium]|jgi:hypothetical protein|nr:hypothetical protein [Planctomycetaceae bacterium]
MKIMMDLMDHSILLNPPTRKMKYVETKSDKIDVIIDVLTMRFKKPSPNLKRKITEINSLKKINELACFAATCVSIEEFDMALD